MDGLATASPHIGATATQVQQLGLTTFTYTTGGAADIQGLADRGGSGGVPRQHQNLHASHGVQIQGLQSAQRPGPGMVIAQPGAAQLPPMSSSRQQGKPDIFVTSVFSNQNRGHALAVACFAWHAR